MSTQREDVQINLKIQGIEDFKTLKDLNGQVIAQRNAVTKMDKGDSGYEAAKDRLKELISLQTEWKKDIYSTKNAADDLKKPFDDISKIAIGSALGNLASQGLQTVMSAVSSFISGSSAAYAEAEQNQAQLAAVLKSTGEAAGRSKDQINDMAGGLMALTGIDDDAIVKSEALLLTFSNISGEIYDQTLPLILDMSKALGQDLNASTIQLGKALNDPIAGLTALKKVGVSFSDDQKNLIKTLQNTGDGIGAQKIILAELTKEFGGASQAIANTESGSLERFQTRIGNMQEVLGEFLIKMKAATVQGLDPFLTKIERWISTPTAEKIQKEQSELNGLVSALVMTNDNQAVRNQLISELQAKYPDFLGKINAETTSNELLTRRLSEVNDQYRQRIFIASNEDRIKIIQEKRTQAIKEEAKARLEVAKASGLSATQLAALSDIQVKQMALDLRNKALQADMNRSGGNAYSSGTSNTLNKEAGNLDLIVNGRTRIAASIKEESDLMGANAVMQAKVTAQRVKDIDYEIAKLKALKSENAKVEIERLQIEKSKLMGTYQVKPAFVPKEDPKAISTAKKVAEEAKKHAEELKKIDEDLTAQAKKLGLERITSTLSETQQEEAAINQKYQALFDKEKDYLERTDITNEQRKTHVAELVELEKNKTLEIADLRVKTEEKMVNDINQLRSSLAETHQSELEKERDQINKFYDDLETKNVGNEKRLAILKKARITDISNAEIRESSRILEEKERIEASGENIEDLNYAGRLAKINKFYDDQIDALARKYSEEGKLTAAYQQLIGAVNANRDKDTEAEKNKKDQQTKDYAIQGAEMIASTVFSIGANNRKKEADMKLKALDDQRNTELSNKNLTEEQKKAINDRYDAKVKQEKLRAWKADQDAAAKQSIISGFLGAAKALPNYVLAGLAMATGIANALVIKAQKAPIFSKGGIPEGPSHAQGGINLVDNKTGNTIGEMEGGEPIMILSRETAKNNGALINDLLFNSQFRNGAKVSVNSELASQVIRPFKTGGIIQDGQTGSSNTAAIVNSINTKSLEDKLEEKFDQLLDKWSEGIPFNYRNDIEFRDKISKIKDSVNG